MITRFTGFGILLSSVLATVTSCDLLAHHAPTEFDLRGNERLELRGKLIDVAWQNPHPRLELSVVGTNGSVDIWRIEVRGALVHLQRSGVSGDLFRVGDAVTIAGAASNRRERVMMGTHVFLPAGTEVLLSAFDMPRWSDSYVGGARGWEIDESIVRQATSESQGLFRVWSFPDRNTHGRAFSSLASAMRPEVRERATTLEQYNRIAAECEPLSMPYVMAQPVNIEFVDGRDMLELRIGNFDAVRTIHMTNDTAPDLAPPSPLGYSVGRWDAGELVIDTTEISTPYSSVVGMVQSESIQVSERFELEDDGAVLRYEMTLTDPETFLWPAVYSFYFVALGEELQRFQCRGD